MRFALLFHVFLCPNLILVQREAEGATGTITRRHGVEIYAHTTQTWRGGIYAYTFTDLRHGLLSAIHAVRTQFTS
jgi:hypothetical protein